MVMDLRKIRNFVKVFFFFKNLKQVFGFMAVGHEPLELSKRNVAWEHHNYICNLCIKHCLHLNKYKYGDGENI